MSFEVIPASVPASAEEWRRAMAAPISELPELNEVQQAEVRQFCLQEDEYRRLRVLMRNLVRERQRSQGVRFGNLIEAMIKPYGEHFSLARVSRRGTPLGWRVTIRHNRKGVVEFQSTLEVVEALVEGSASEQDAEIFRHNVLEELGQAGFLEVAG